MGQARPNMTAGAMRLGASAASAPATPSEANAADRTSTGTPMTPTQTSPASHQSFFVVNVSSGMVRAPPQFTIDEQKLRITLAKYGHETLKGVRNNGNRARLN